MASSRLSHTTELGRYFVGDSANALKSSEFQDLRGKVQLILTSPPFPLNNKKSYGNLSGEEFKEWFVNLAPLYSDLITEDGSIVIEMGNSWVQDRPVQSLLHLESLIGFVNNPTTRLRLCQQLVVYNPARLPSPAAWVTVNRIRLTDSFTNVWWMAKSDFPKADNRKVTRAYSDGMQKLLRRQKYNSGKRPSEHQIGDTSFLKDNGGSISHNLFELEQMESDRTVRLPNAFSISNTTSNDYYMRQCREKGIDPHPARMPSGLAAFFIEFLTEPGDIVFDPFAGSNTTGYVSEMLGRKWVSFDAMEEYAVHSEIRLSDPALSQQKDQDHSLEE